MKKTLVLGASTDPSRYSYLAVEKLKRHGHEVIAVGKELGKIGATEILIQIPKNEKVHTLTLYLNPTRQKALYEEIINLNPERIIFNPGTENAELEALARKKGIQTEEACTLVLLSTEQY